MQRALIGLMALRQQPQLRRGGAALAIAGGWLGAALMLALLSAIMAFFQSRMLAGKAGCGSGAGDRVGAPVCERRSSAARRADDSSAWAGRSHEGRVMRWRPLFDRTDFARFEDGQRRAF